MKRISTLLVAMTTVCCLSLRAQSTTTYTDIATGLKFELQDSKAQTGNQVALIVADDSYSTITDLVIPQTVKRLTGKTTFAEYIVVGISANAFKSNKSLKKVTLAQNALVQIGKSAFQGCTALEEVDLSIHWSSSITDIEKITLSINFAKEITVTIGKVEKVMNELFPSVFDGCTSLKTVKLSEYHTEIGTNAFKDCAALESVNLDGLASLTTFDDYAFSGCSSLKNIYIGDKVTTFGKHVFEGCTALNYVEWNTALVGDFTAPDDSNPSPFYDLRDNADFEIENLSTMTRVPAYFCYGIKNIYGPCMAEEIGAHAYEGCTNMDINTISLEGIKKIEESAFDGPKFIQVQLPAVPPVIYDENVFGDVRNTAQFYVSSALCEAVEPYEADANWSKFNIDATGSRKVPKIEHVVLDEHPTGAGTSMTLSNPTFPIIPTCNNPYFTAVIRDEAVARCYDALGNETIIPFGYYEYKGEKYYTRTVELYQTNVDDVLTVVFTADVPDAVEDLKSDTNYRKVVRDGQLLILHNGKTYNALGAEVK